MEALDNIELLAKTDRRIVRFDALGAGSSDSLPEAKIAGASLTDLTSWTATEVAGVARAAKLGPFHLFVAGGVCGAELAAALVKEGSGVSVASVVFEAGSEPAVGELPALANSCATDGFAQGNSAVMELANQLANRKHQKPSSLVTPLLYIDTYTTAPRDPFLSSENEPLSSHVAIPSSSFAHYENEKVGKLLDEIQIFLDRVEGK